MLANDVAGQNADFIGRQLQQMGGMIGWQRQAALRLAPEIVKTASYLHEKDRANSKSASDAIKMALKMVDETTTPEVADVSIKEIVGL